MSINEHRRAAHNTKSNQKTKFGKSSIQQLFTTGKAYIAYLTAGDGGIQHTLAAALALIKGGVNLLEIGMPFSDPIADGPVIQRATARALQAGTTLKEVLWLVQQIRKQSNIPLVLFSYYNPILSALSNNFLADAKKAGIDGLLLVDCPLEESDFIHQQCRHHDIDLIYILSPSTSEQRLRKIAKHAQGFLYYACRKGTTGLRNDLPNDFQTKIQTLKSITNVPIAVGFGISDPKMAQKVLAEADGVVVGSLFVKALEEGMNLDNLTSLAKNIYGQS